MASRRYKPKRKPWRSLVLAGALATAAAAGGYLLSSSSKTSEKPQDNKPVPEFRQPEVKRPQLTFDVLPTIPGVKRVLSTYGDSPEVVYILLQHQSPMIEEGVQVEKSTMPVAEKICDFLNENWGVNSLLMEGLDEKDEGIYKAYGKVNIRSDSKSDVAQQENESLARILNTRRWNIYPGTRVDLEERIRKLRQPIMNIYSDFFRELKVEDNRFKSQVQEGKIDRKELERQFVDNVRRLTSIKQGEVEKVRTPLLVESLFSLLHPQRNAHIAHQAVRCNQDRKTPLIVVYGGGHFEDLSKEFKNAGLGYAALVPEGYSGRFSATPEDIKRSLNIPQINFNFEN